MNLFDVRSFFYNFQRLQKPYEDSCEEYLFKGFISRRDAIIKCMNEYTQDSLEVVEDTVIDESEDLYDNYTMKIDTYYDHIEQECSLKYDKPDCERSIYFTSVESYDQFGIYDDEIHISIEKDILPSFFVLSKARINDIDYVTYILGAVGSWLGLSFVSLNPIPYLFEIKNNSISPTVETVNHKLKSMKTCMLMRISILEHEKRVTRIELAENKRKFSEILNDLNSMKQCILASTNNSAYHSTNCQNTFKNTMEHWRRNK